MKTVKEFIDELKRLPEDAFIFIGDIADEIEPVIECGESPELFSGYTVYHDYCRIVESK